MSILQRRIFLDINTCPDPRTIEISIFLLQTVPPGDVGSEESPHVQSWIEL